MSSPPPAPPPRKQGTEQRILDCCAELFNEFGIEAVSIAQIAGRLGISPGNLTYHYKRKIDLVSALAASFEQELSQGLEGFPFVSSSERFVAAYLELIEVTLRYRFLFTGANFILQQKFIVPERYEALMDTVKRTTLKRSQWLIREGFMREVAPPHSLDMLIDNMWWAWLGWLHVSQLRASSADAARSALPAQIVSHLAFLAHPYMDAEFSRGVQREIARIDVAA